MDAQQPSRIRAFLKRTAGLWLVTGALGIYVVVAGTTGSCGACSAITASLGLPSGSGNVQAASVVPTGQAAATTADAKTAPPWELKGLDGETVAFSDFEGKVVLIDFWATWCPPCRKSIPEFVELQKEYGDEGFVIVGISLDRKGAGVVKPFAEKMNINYPIVLGNQKVVAAFGGIRGIPTAFVVNREGEIVHKHVGYAPKSAFEKQIKPLL